MDRIAVIGRGLIGSAAARHLTSLTDGVVLVGPDEPADRATHQGVFASHYDEGRITSVADPEPAWAVTAKRSIDRYAGIEAESGIGFFTAAGYLVFGDEPSTRLERGVASGQRLGTEIESLDTEGIRDRFPYLRIKDGSAGFHQTSHAGYVSPRAMVRAQSQLAVRGGARLVNAAVQHLRLIGSGVEIETDTGETVRCDRVLVATGAFTDACGLLPESLHLRVFGRTVALVRIDPDLPEDLSSMPSLGHVESGAYMLPPILYPDGNRYLKIGIGTTDDPEPRSLTELKSWFKGPGSAANIDRFPSFLTDLIPVLSQASAWHFDTCAVTWTATGLPYIDQVNDPRITVAVGGNGKGAKGSDDWGWIAARLALGLELDHPVSRDALRIPGREQLAS